MGICSLGADTNMLRWEMWRTKKELPKRLSIDQEKSPVSALVTY